MKKKMVLILLLFFLIGCSAKSGNTVTGEVVAPTTEQQIEEPSGIPPVEKEKTVSLKIGTKEECETQKGGWIKTKNVGAGELHYSCHEKFDDSGKNCFDNKDCKGLCVPFGDIDGLVAYGKCSDYDSIESCEIIVSGKIENLPNCPA